MIVQKEIRKIDGKYYVYSSKGKRLSRGYASKKDAVARLREIEHFKEAKTSHPFMNDLNSNDE